MARKPINGIGIAAIMLATAVAACSPQRASTARFTPLPPQGWHRSMPLVLEPEYPDSAARYDVTLSVRHTASYPYSELTLAVDLLPDSGQAVRQQVVFHLADRSGNWRGAGFGALYQMSKPLASAITPTAARRVAVWQAMQGVDTVAGLTEIGITVTPTE